MLGIGKSMKKHLGVLVVATMLVVMPILVLAKNRNHDIDRISKATIEFNKNFCKTVSHHPLITVCVGGDQDEAKLTLRTEKAITKGTAKLLAQYRKIENLTSIKFNTTSSCTYADWDSTECGGDTSYCEAYQNDPMCVMMNCNYYNWESGLCGDAETYCDAYPNDSICISSNCTYLDWDPAECGGAATYCIMYSTDPICSMP